MEFVIVWCIAWLAHLGQVLSPLGHRRAFAPVLAQPPRAPQPPRPVRFRPQKHPGHSP